MSHNFRNSYFYHLPIEVTIEILSYIDTLTLFTFCESYDCDYLLKDRDVTRTVNVHKIYKLEDFREISKKIVLEHVSTLNVNCLYWVQAAKLRKFVTKLVNLETLYAIQTNLSLSGSDTEVFSKSKIKKLGISVKRDDELGTHKIPTVKTLYINIVKVTYKICPKTLDLLFPGVTKLWIDVEEPCGGEIILHYLNAENKNKIFCQVNASISSINFEDYWLTTYYNNRRACQPYVMCCEKFNAKQRKSTFEIGGSLRSWKVLDDLHCSKPYGPKDARRLVNEKSLDNIYFEELNFRHTAPFCNHRCREAVEDILKSENCTRLRKLSVMMCLFHDKNARECVNLQDPHSFMRKRIGVENSVSSHPVGEIFRNFLGLQHLEIYVCNETAHHSSIQGYPLISLFANLQSLTVEIPVTLDGSFLIQVVKECNQLQRLKVTSPSQHEKLNYTLRAAVTNARSLRDFRFENHRIQMDKILEKLSQIEYRTLERIVLVCKEVDRFTAGPIREFLEQNPQLIFVYFIIQNCTEAARRMAKQTFYSYKKKHPSKVFLVKKTDVFNQVGNPVPDVHFFEMVKTDNNVGSLSAVNDFVTF